MNDSDLSDSSYHTALDTFDGEEFDLLDTLIEDSGKLIENQKEFDFAPLVERENASGRHLAKANGSPKIFKIGGVKKAEKKRFSFLSGRQYQRFRDEIKKQYLLSNQSQNSRCLKAADLVNFIKGESSLEDTAEASSEYAADSYDIREESFTFSNEEAIKVQGDPWQSKAAPGILEDTDNLLSFEDSFVCYYSRPSSETKVEKSSSITAVTVQPRSLSSSIEQLEDEAKLLEDAVEPPSVCSWFRAKWETIRKSCC